MGFWDEVLDAGNYVGGGWAMDLFGPDKKKPSKNKKPKKDQNAFVTKGDGVITYTVDDNGGNQVTVPMLNPRTGAVVSRPRVPNKAIYNPPAYKTVTPKITMPKPAQKSDWRAQWESLMATQPGVIDYTNQINALMNGSQTLTAAEEKKYRQRAQQELADANRPLYNAIKDAQATSVGNRKNSADILKSYKKDVETTRKNSASTFADLLGLVSQGQVADIAASDAGATALQGMFGADVDAGAATAQSRVMNNAERAGQSTAASLGSAAQNDFLANAGVIGSAQHGEYARGEMNAASKRRKELLDDISANSKKLPTLVEQLFEKAIDRKGSAANQRLQGLQFLQQQNSEKYNRWSDARNISGQMLQSDMAAQAKEEEARLDYLAKANKPKSYDRIQDDLQNILSPQKGQVPDKETQKAITKYKQNQDPSGIATILQKQGHSAEDVRAFFSSFM